MTRASVGGGEGRDATEGEVRGAGEGGRGLMAAERSASSGEEEDVGGTVRVRPSKLMAWSLCLSQHLLQMRLLMETSTCAFSCRVKVPGEESG